VKVKNIDELYDEAVTQCGSTLRRLAKGWEADPERRRDLLQEIHIELWRSLRLFDERCSLKTWAYRVAQNVAASYILRVRRSAARLVDLETLDHETLYYRPMFVDGESSANRHYLVSRLLDMIHRLKPLDRQIILLYLEGEPAASIAEVTGLSAANVATKIHRIKGLLNEQSVKGAMHEE
jgi:RNA polymerase sigma-70 factor, ECF subfamily